MIKDILVYISTFTFILLWMQAAYPKFKDIKKFSEILGSQAVPRWSVGFLTWTIPLIELIAVVLLAIPKFSIYGFYISFVLMLIFTVYVGCIRFRLFNQPACPCGSLFKGVRWNEHFWINVLLTIVAGLTIVHILKL